MLIFLSLEIFVELSMNENKVNLKNSHFNIWRITKIGHADGNGFDSNFHLRHQSFSQVAISLAQFILLLQRHRIAV